MTELQRKSTGAIIQKKPFAYDHNVTVYTPEPLLRRPGLLVRSMAADLRTSRELAWRLFLRDTRAKYRNSLLGYLWIFVPPLVAALPFVFLNSQGVVKMGETPLPYGAYAMIGTTIWQVFVDAINTPILSVSSGRGMLTRIKFPREALLLAALMQVGFNFFIRLTLIVFVLVLYAIVPPATALLFPIGVVSLVLTGFAIGVFLTPLAMLYGDVQKALAVILPFWMFLTPILYPAPQSGLAKSIISLNPLTPLVTTTRDWLTLGTSANLLSFLLVTSTMIVLCVASWILYRVSMPHIITRLGN